MRALALWARSVFFFLSCASVLGEKNITKHRRRQVQEANKSLAAAAAGRTLTLQVVDTCQVQSQQISTFWLDLPFQNTLYRHFPSGRCAITPTYSSCKDFKHILRNPEQKETDCWFKNILKLFWHSFSGRYKVGLMPQKTLEQSENKWDFFFAPITILKHHCIIHSLGGVCTEEGGFAWLPVQKERKSDTQSGKRLKWHSQNAKEINFHRCAREWLCVCAWVYVCVFDHMPLCVQQQLLGCYAALSAGDGEPTPCRPRRGVQTKDALTGRKSWKWEPWMRDSVHIFNHSKEKSGRKWFNVARWPISPQRFLCGLQGFSINPKKRSALNINSVVCGEVDSPPAGWKQLEASQRSQQAATARLILHVSPPDCL